MAREILVATGAEVSPCEARGFVVDGRQIILCVVDDEIFALQGLCTHQALPLDGGEVDDGVLTCEWHGARFDVRSGEVLALPATRPLNIYPVRVDADDRVYVTLSD